MTENSIVLFYFSGLHSSATLSTKLDRTITYFDVNKKNEKGTQLNKSFQLPDNTF